MKTLEEDDRRDVSYTVIKMSPNMTPRVFLLSLMTMKWCRVLHIYPLPSSMLIFLKQFLLHKNIYFLGPNCCEVQHTTHLLQLPQECGHTQCKQAITGRVFSGNLPMLFVSVQRLQRVSSRSERAQNGNEPGRAGFRLRVGGWIYLKRSCRHRMC